MNRYTSARDLRVAAYYVLLERLSRCRLPAECTESQDIDLVLALRSAMLIEACIEVPEVLRTGERRMGRAVVTAITAQGRQALAKRLRSSQAAGRSLRAKDAR